MRSTMIITALVLALLGTTIACGDLPTATTNMKRAAPSDELFDSSGIVGVSSSVAFLPSVASPSSAASPSPSTIENHETLVASTSGLIWDPQGSTPTTHATTNTISGTPTTTSTAASSVAATPTPAQSSVGSIVPTTEPAKPSSSSTIDPKLAAAIVAPPVCVSVVLFFVAVVWHFRRSHRRALQQLESEADAARRYGNNNDRPAIELQGIRVPGRVPMAPKELSANERHERLSALRPSPSGSMFAHRRGSPISAPSESPTRFEGFDFGFEA